MHAAFTRISFIVFAISLLIRCGHPRDATMINRYQTNQAAFTALKDAALGYPSVSLTRHTIRDYSIEPGAVENLREQMKALGVIRLSVSSTSDTVRFETSNLQLGFSFSRKGYVYREQAPLAVAIEKNLDTISHRTEVAGFSIYRLVDDDWYLYLEYID